MTDFHALNKKLASGNAAEESAPLEKRKEPRYASEGEAEVTPLGIGAGEPLPAKVIDVSKSGIRIRVPRPFNAGERLRVKFGDMLAFAVVRWCRPLEEGFDAGMRIEHIVPSSLVNRVRRAAPGAGG